MKFITFLSLLLATVVVATAQDEDAAAASCDCSSECESLVSKKVDDLTKTHSRKVNSIQTRFDASKKETADEKTKVELLTKQLEESTAGASALEKELALAKAAHGDALAQLSTSQKDIASLEKELDTIKKREMEFQKEAETTMATLHQEMEDLMNHKIKASEMETHIEALQKDLLDHREELTSTKSSLSKELDDHKQELLLMRQKSLKDQELLDIMHEKATTTYINTTLIYEDAALGATKAAAQMSVWYALLKESSKPHYEESVKLYKQHAEPHLTAAQSQVQEAYNQHLKETVDKDVFPALEPALSLASEYRNKAHAMTSEGLALGADTVYKYLKITGEEGEEDTWRTWLGHQFQWITEHAGDIVTNVTYGIVIFVLLRFFVLPLFGKRRRSPPKNTPTPPKGLPKGRNGGNKGKRGRKNGAPKVKGQ